MEENLGKFLEALEEMKGVAEFCVDQMVTKKHRIFKEVKNLQLQA